MENDDFVCCKNMYTYSSNIVLIISIVQKTFLYIDLANKKDLMSNSNHTTVKIFLLIKN